eukprot:6197416-Pleurochrysis_carterae.AAC.1
MAGEAVENQRGKLFDNLPQWQRGAHSFMRAHDVDLHWVLLPVVSSRPPSPRQVSENIVRLRGRNRR